MPWPWQTRRDLENRIHEQRCCMDSYKAEIDRLKERSARLSEQLEQAQQASAKIESLLQGQIDYWKRVAESATDRVLHDATGVPLYRQIPQAAPLPDGNEPEDEQEPLEQRLSRNPRAFVNQATANGNRKRNRADLQRVVDEGRKRDLERQVEAELDKIDRETKTQPVVESVG